MGFSLRGKITSKSRPRISGNLVTVGLSLLAETAWSESQASLMLQRVSSNTGESFGANAYERQPI